MTGKRADRASRVSSVRSWEFGNRGRAGAISPAGAASSSGLQVMANSVTGDLHVSNVHASVTVQVGEDVVGSAHGVVDAEEVSTTDISVIGEIAVEHVEVLIERSEKAVAGGVRDRIGPGVEHA